MSLFPDSRIGKIEFYEAHIGPWTASAAQIGLDPSAVAALATLVGEARDAYDAAQSAREASKAATTAFHNAVKAMHSGAGAGSDMIDTIRNYAQSKNNPNVYVLAQIPAPATPGTIPPPGKAYEFEVGLLENGALTLRWKCDNPSGSSGTLYEVRRVIGDPNVGMWALIGSSGKRSFVDDTLPQGSASSPVTYQIRAVRSTSFGEPAQFTVTFGVASGNSARFATVVQTAPAPIGDSSIRAAA
ncbi:MAG: hypothetical protein AB7Q00_09730 [Phycisphaerales bacterium]